MSEAQVTIVVVPRERFSYTQKSLESIYEHTSYPFKLVYVDGNSPAKVHDYLKAQADLKGFELFRTDYYLSPNQARNLGAKQVRTKYLVFIDNDVIVSPGWLETLVECAEQTGATVVGPLVCQHEPLHEEVHCAGGEAHVITDIQGRQHLRSKLSFQGQKVAKVLPNLQRTLTEHAEFHCVLVRTEIFSQIGYLDESLLSYCEHQDFCMTVAKIGQTVYLEPDSVVTYVPGKLELTDFYFHALRWSDDWTRKSLNHFFDKWELSKESSYIENQLKAAARRRGRAIVAPIANSLSFGLENKPLKKILHILENAFGNYISDYHSRQNLSCKVSSN